MTPAELRRRLSEFAQDVELFANPLIDALRTRDAALQLKRSSSGIAANHRAAGKGRSHDEFTSSLSVALQEADETVFWLTQFHVCGHGEPNAVRRLLAEAKEVAAILGKSTSTARQTQRRRREAKRRGRRAVG